MSGTFQLAELVGKQMDVPVVCLDTLEYLQRGGRIGNATRFIGSLLDIKP
jgi:fatty acid-binding protein DegV